MATFFAVLMLISSLVLIVSVLMQESKQEGLGSIGGGATDSIFGKSIGTSKQALLRKVTIVASVVFMISALGLAI